MLLIFLFSLFAKLNAKNPDSTPKIFQLNTRNLLFVKIAAVAVVVIVLLIVALNWKKYKISMVLKEFSVKNKRLLQLELEIENNRLMWLEPENIAKEKRENLQKLNQEKDLLNKEQHKLVESLIKMMPWYKKFDNENNSFTFFSNVECLKTVFLNLYNADISEKNLETDGCETGGRIDFNFLFSEGKFKQFNGKEKYTKLQKKEQTIVPILTINIADNKTLIFEMYVSNDR